MHRKALLVVAAFGLAAVAHTQVTAIGPFTGDLSDSFETQPRGQFLGTYQVFGGSNHIDSIGAPNLLITGSWSFFGVTFARTGQVFMGGAGCNQSYVFPGGASKFGGYWCTNTDMPDAVATFYDMSNTLIGTLPVTAPTNGSWTWNGWQSTVPLGHVDVIAANRFGGFIDMDDMEMTNPGGGGFTIPPDNFNVFRGVRESGGLPELTSSDDQYMVIRNGVTALRTESPITLIVEGHAPTLVVTLSVQVENHVSITGLTQRVDAFNFVTSSYTNLDTRPATTTDSVVVAPITGPPAYIDANRLVRMQVRIRADGPVFTNTWRSFVDQTIWTGT